MPARNPMPPDEAVQLYLLGMSHKKIAQKLGVSCGVILRILREAGVAMRPSRNVKQYTPEQRADRARLADRRHYRDNLLPERQRAREKVRRRFSDPVQRAKIYEINWRSRLRRLYGITAEEYKAMVLSQHERCAICDTNEPGIGWTRWAIDHDHKTGKIRGLLCARCNGGLGIIGDQHDSVSEWTMKALAYLRRSICLQ